MTSPRVPADDDPRFNRWLAEVGPPPPLPPDDVPLVRPLIAGIAMAAAVTGMGIAIGIAWGFAFGAITAVIAIPGLIVTVAFTAAVLYYLLSRAS